MSKQKIVVLGGGADQIDLIKDLKERGFYTVLVDYYENPIAKPYADKHVHESTLDMDKVLEICKTENAINVITACTDQALLTVAYVAERMGYNKQFTFEQAQHITNKLYMKKIMWDNHIPTSKYVNITSLEDGIGDLCYPLMVKPADCNGSYGVRKACNEEELKVFFANAANASRTHRVIVEEFKEGIEVSVDGFIQHNQAQILMIGQLNKKKVNENTLLIYQNVVPAQINDAAREKISQIANQIATAFELDNTPLLMQMIVNGDEVNVIEFSARIGGGAKHRLIKAKTGFDVLHANVDCILGGHPEVCLDESGDVFIRTHLYTHNCVFDSICNYEELLNNHEIEELVQIKTKGMRIENSYASRDRVGSFLIKAESYEKGQQLTRKILNTIQVIDSEGRNVINQDIYR